MITAVPSFTLGKLRTALSFHGLRSQQEFDELAYSSPDCEIRLTLRENQKGQIVRCFICVDESRLLTSGLEIFNDLSLEGCPVVDFGTGGAKSTFEFQWIHPEGADWRISAQRVEGLRQRLVGVLGERRSSPRPSTRSRRSMIYSELVPAVFGHPATAA